MNTQTRSKFIVLMNIGLVIALLVSHGIPALMPTGVKAEALDKNIDLPFISSVQENPDGELDEKLEQFEGYLADMQRELAIPGMSVAIVKDQEIVWAQGFGYADVDARRPATPDTPYEIASITKTLSSTILLLLLGQFMPASR